MFAFKGKPVLLNRAVVAQFMRKNSTAVSSITNQPPAEQSNSSAQNLNLSRKSTSHLDQESLPYSLFLYTDLSHKTENNSHLIQTVRTEISNKIDATNARIDNVNIDLSKKIEATNSRIDSTNSRIEAVRDDLSKKIDTVRDDLSKKIDTVRDDLSKKIENSSKETKNSFNYLISTLLGGFIAISGVILSLFIDGKLALTHNLEKDKK